MSEIISTPPTGENIAHNSVNIDASAQSRSAVADQVRALLEKQEKAAPRAAAQADDDESADPSLPGDTSRAAPRQAEQAEPEEKISAIVRARAKASRMRRDAEAQARDLGAQRAQLEQERREVARIRSASEKMREDPLAGLRELGVDLNEVNERVALEGTAEAKFRALQEMITRQREELDTYRKTQQQREHSTTVQQAERDFAALAGNEEQFPFLAARAALHPRGVMQQAYPENANPSRACGSAGLFDRRGVSFDRRTPSDPERPTGRPEARQRRRREQGAAKPHPFAIPFS